MHCRMAFATVWLGAFLQQSLSIDRHHDYSNGRLMISLVYKVPVYLSARDTILSIMTEKAIVSTLGTPSVLLQNASFINCVISLKNRLQTTHAPPKAIEIQYGH